MVHNDNNQIGIEFACRKPMYMGQDENRTANQNYLLDSNWHIKNEISEGGVICLTLLAIRVCLCWETATEECLPGKRLQRLSWLFRFMQIYRN